VKVNYWLSVLGLSFTEFQSKLAELNVHISENARTLPKGSLAKLRRAFPTTQFPVGIVELETEQEGTAQNSEVNYEKVPPPVWGSREPKDDIRYITKEQVDAIYQSLIDGHVDGDEPVLTHGVYDEQKLDSAVMRAPLAAQKYFTPQLATAATLHSLIKNHALPNGNKRTAVISMMVMLDMNGLALTCDETEIFRLAYNVASSNLLKFEPSRYDNLWEHETWAIGQWLDLNTGSKLSEARKRPLKWSNLRKTLTELGCDFELQGNRIKISRTIKMPGIFNRTQRPSRVIIISHDGQDCDKGMIEDLRKAFELDPDHGVADADFYSGSPTRPSEFIVRHSALIRRLAKV
jgi:death-on-curing family protein